MAAESRTRMQHEETSDKGSSDAKGKDIESPRPGNESFHLDRIDLTHSASSGFARPEHHEGHWGKARRLGLEARGDRSSYIDIKGMREMGQLANDIGDFLAHTSQNNPQPSSPPDTAGHDSESSSSRPSLHHPFSSFGRSKSKNTSKSSVLPKDSPTPSFWEKAKSTFTHHRSRSPMASSKSPGSAQKTKASGRAKGRTATSTSKRRARKGNGKGSALGSGRFVSTTAYDAGIFNNSFMIYDDTPAEEVMIPYSPPKHAEELVYNNGSLLFSRNPASGKKKRTDAGKAAFKKKLYECHVPSADYQASSASFDDPEYIENNRYSHLPHKLRSVPAYNNQKKGHEDCPTLSARSDASSFGISTGAESGYAFSPPSSTPASAQMPRASIAPHIQSHTSTESNKLASPVAGAHSIGTWNSNVFAASFGDSRRRNKDSEGLGISIPPPLRVSNEGSFSSHFTASPVSTGPASPTAPVTASFPMNSSVGPSSPSRPVQSARTSDSKSGHKNSQDFIEGQLAKQFEASLRTSSKDSFTSQYGQSDVSSTSRDRSHSTKGIVGSVGRVIKNEWETMKKGAGGGALYASPGAQTSFMGSSTSPTPSVIQHGHSRSVDASTQRTSRSSGPWPTFGPTSGGESPLKLLNKAIQERAELNHEHYRLEKAAKEKREEYAAADAQLVAARSHATLEGAACHAAWKNQQDEQAKRVEKLRQECVKADSKVKMKRDECAQADRDVNDLTRIVP